MEEKQPRKSYTQRLHQKEGGGETTYINLKKVSHRQRLHHLHDQPTPGHDGDEVAVPDRTPEQEYGRLQHVGTVRDVGLNLENREGGKGFKGMKTAKNTEDVPSLVENGRKLVETRLVETSEVLKTGAQNTRGGVPDLGSGRGFSRKENLTAELAVSTKPGANNQPKPTPEPTTPNKTNQTKTQPLNQPPTTTLTRPKPTEIPQLSARKVSQGLIRMFEKFQGGPDQGGRPPPPRDKPTTPKPTLQKKPTNLKPTPRTKTKPTPILSKTQPLITSMIRNEILTKQTTTTPTTPPPNQPPNHNQPPIPPENPGSSKPTEIDLEPNKTGAIPKTKTWKKPEKNKNGEIKKKMIEKGQSDLRNYFKKNRVEATNVKIVEKEKLDFVFDGSPNPAAGETEICRPSLQTKPNGMKGSTAKRENLPL